MLRPLEAIYLISGMAIIFHGVFTQTLTVTSLGAGMFFIGLVPVTRADRAEMDTPAGFIRKALLAYLSKGGGSGKGGK